MAQNAREFEALARANLGAEAFAYLAGGSDDERTLRRNCDAFAGIAIRARRLVDVTRIDTSITLLGESWPSPIMLGPVGVQGIFHPEGEIASARAAARTGHRFTAATLSNHAVGDVAKAAGRPPWFQLYPTPDREVTAGLIAAAEAAGCPVLVLTVDVPVIGNREGQRAFFDETITSLPFGNLDPFGGYTTFADPAMTWEIIPWIRARTTMKLILKGIVTAEDAHLAVEHGVDGLIVSNHGGRQEESDRATIECLPEVVEAADASGGASGGVPVILDSGIRRGTDVFKALALGARAVAIGRAFVWALAADGEAGVARALEILDAELVRAMQLAGATRIGQISPACVLMRPPPSRPGAGT